MSKIKYIVECGIWRLREIKKRKLHNDLESLSSGFILITAKNNLPTLMVYVYEEAKLIGYAYAQQMIEPYDKNLSRYHIIGVFIDPKHRNKGYAKKALKKLIMHLKFPRHQKHKIHLWTAKITGDIIKSFHDKRLLVSRINEAN